MPHRFVYWLVLSMVAAGCSSSRPDDSGHQARQTELSRRLAAAEAPLVIAHRGDSGSYPENTLIAFLSANAIDADAIEFDVRQSRDGVLVCLHDEFLDRTTDATRRLGRDRIAVSSLDASQLRKLDAGSWKGAKHAGEPLPFLAQVLPLIAGDCVPIIERKGGDPERYVELIRELGLEARVIVTSFDWDFLAELHQAAPELTLGAIGDGPLTTERMAGIDALGASLVHWNHRDLDADALAELQARGYLVLVYTIDEQAGLIGAARAGVDGITTNQPARLLELRAGGQLRR